MELAFYDLLLWLTFTLCLSLTVAGILATFRIEQSKRTTAHQYLQYALIFLYVFGYYNLWGGILLPRLLVTEDISSVVRITTQLASPFFLLALAMLLLWSVSLLSQTLRKLIPFTLLIAVLSSLAFLRWGWNSENSVSAVVAIMGFVTLSGIFIGITLNTESTLKPESKNLILALSACAGLLYLTYFTSLNRIQFYAPIYALCYFLFNTVLAIEFIYATSKESHKSLGEFIKNFQISKREADVMQGIYAGKTNQEIANSLFISLQTVKDHSSRIYQKVQVKNRNQLTAILRENS